MKRAHFRPLLVLCLALAIASPADAHKLRQSGLSVAVATPALTVIPPRDWNQLSGRPGPNAESWTLDGRQLNQVTFYGGIAPGTPLLRERDKKRAPLPKFTSDALLVELPELLERTYRADQDLATFQILSSEPTRFLGVEGISFRYTFADKDELTRMGEARAAIIAKKLYMIAFEAPKLHYFARNVADFQVLADTARLR